MPTVRLRFHGQIAGVGSQHGTRIVVGRWDRSPLGAFADVMVERPDGHRVLLAPTQAVADFIHRTYTFDEVQLVPVTVACTPGGWTVAAGLLRLRLMVGRSTALGLVLGMVPPPVTRSVAFATLADPVARVALRGVRTRGTAGDGRREWYSARGIRRVTGIQGSYAGVPLGALRPVLPAVRFGFSSTPRTPSVTTVVTTVEVSEPSARSRPRW